MKTHSVTRALACLAVAVASVTAIGAERPKADIERELGPLKEPIFKEHELSDLVDPVQRPELAAKLIEPLRHVLAVERELLATYAPREPDPYFLSEESRELALLALYGDPAAHKELTEASESSKAYLRTMGRQGLIMEEWWSKPNAEKQKVILDQQERLAIGEPKNEQLETTLEWIGQAGQANLETGNHARAIIEEHLTGVLAKRDIARLAKIGKPFAVEVDTTNHHTFNTAEWKGKVVMIDFWASWCVPCREELPHILKVYEENHKKGLEILGITNDVKEPDLQHFLDENRGMNWMEHFNPAKGTDHWNELSLKLEVSEIPTKYIIDRDGILRAIVGKHIPEALILRLLDEKVNKSRENEKENVVHDVKQ